MSLALMVKIKDRGCENDTFKIKRFFVRLQKTCVCSILGRNN